MSSEGPEESKTTLRLGGDQRTAESPILPSLFTLEVKHRGGRVDAAGAWLLMVQHAFDIMDPPWTPEDMKKAWNTRATRDHCEKDFSRLQLGDFDVDKIMVEGRSKLRSIFRRGGEDQELHTNTRLSMLYALVLLFRSVKFAVQSVCDEMVAQGHLSEAGHTGKYKMKLHDITLMCIATNVLSLNYCCVSGMIEMAVNALKWRMPALAYACNVQVHVIHQKVMLWIARGLGFDVEMEATLANGVQSHLFTHLLDITTGSGHQSYLTKCVEGLNVRGADERCALLALIGGKSISDLSKTARGLWTAYGLYVLGVPNQRHVDLILGLEKIGSKLGACSSKRKLRLQTFGDLVCHLNVLDMMCGHAPWARNGTAKGYSLMTGTTYEGGWKDGQFHGEGSLYGLVSERFFEYTGSFSNGERCGKGTLKLTCCNGAQTSEWEYCGEWQKGLMWGYGTLTYPGGHFYQGHWMAGVPHGQGKCKSYRKYATAAPDDWTGVEATWRYGNATGQGVVTMSCGTVYTGEIDQGLPHGEGTSVDAVSEYTGSFRRGVRRGTGSVRFFKTGASVSGDCWKDDTLTHGVIAITDKGLVYEGMVQRYHNNYRPHGLGTLWQWFGRWEGAFEDGYATGMGYLTPGRPFNTDDLTENAFFASTKVRMEFGRPVNGWYPILIDGTLVERQIVNGTWLGTRPTAAVRECTKTVHHFVTRIVTGVVEQARLRDAIPHEIRAACANVVATVLSGATPRWIQKNMDARANDARYARRTHERGEHDRHLRARRRRRLAARRAWPRVAARVAEFTRVAAVRAFRAHQAERDAAAAARARGRGPPRLSR